MKGRCLVLRKCKTKARSGLLMVYQGQLPGRGDLDLGWKEGLELALVK